MAEDFDRKDLERQLIIEASAFLIRSIDLFEPAGEGRFGVFSCLAVRKRLLQVLEREKE